MKRFTGWWCSQFDGRGLSEWYVAQCPVGSERATPVGCASPGQRRSAFSKIAYRCRPTTGGAQGFTRLTMYLLCSPDPSNLRPNVHMLQLFLFRAEPVEALRQASGERPTHAPTSSSTARPRFQVFEVNDAEALTQRPRHADHSRETFVAALDAAMAIAADKFLPHNRASDEAEPPSTASA